MTSTDTNTGAAAGTDSATVKALEELKKLKEGFAALLPKPATEDKGTITREDGETVAGALLVHHAMRSVAEQLAQKVKEVATGDTRVLIVRSLDQASDRFTHRLVVLRLEELASRATAVLESMEEPPKVAEAPPEDFTMLVDPATAGGLAALAGAAVDFLIGATQSNLTIREGPAVVKRSALIAPVIDRLLDRDVPVLIDEMSALSGTNPVLTRLAALLEIRDRLVSAAAWTRASLAEGEAARLVVELTEHIKSLREKITAAKGAEFKKLKTDLARALQSRLEAQQSSDLAKHKADLADAVVAAVNEYVVAITTATEASPAPLLTASFQTEIKDTDLVLFLETATAGGGSLWKKSPGPDKALHHGGTAVSWLLAAGSGEVRAAGVEVALSSNNSKPDETVDLRSARATTITT